MRLFLKSIFALAAVPLFFASTASATTITFAPPPGFSTGTPLGTYTEFGYTVTSPAGNWVENFAQGNPAPGITGGNVVSPKSPTSTLTITQNGGGNFSFTGFDLNSYGSTSLAPASYTITGMNGASTVFSVSNASVVTSGHWVTFDPAGISGNVVTSVTITVTNPTTNSEYSLDNIVLTPEPNSLFLLGTGLLGLGPVARRKVFA